MLDYDSKLHFFCPPQLTQEYRFDWNGQLYQFKVFTASDSHISSKACQVMPIAHF